METRQGAVVLAYNLQREQITPSEKAYAYKMEYDAIKKKAGRKNRYVLYCVKRYVQN